MHRPLFLLLLLAMLLGGCGPLFREQRPRYFWPPPPGEPRIEYLNFYFSDEDLQRGVDRRLEHALLGKNQPVRLLTLPYSVASDGKGRIFVSDFARKQVIVLDRSAHAHRPLFSFEMPAQKIVIDDLGEIWVLSGLSSRIYRFSGDEKPLATIDLPEMGRPSSLAVDTARQRLYVTDSTSHQLRIFNFAGEPVATFGKRGSGPGEFNFPTDLDIDREGNIYLIDSMNARIQVLAPDGTFLRAFGERGTESGSFSIPKGIAVSPSAIVYVTDANQNKIVVFNTAGEYLITLGGRYVYDGTAILPGGFYFPAGIDIDANETIFIADLFNGMIHEFQYLTPAFLKSHPIDPGSVYHPKAEDLAPPAEESVLPAVTAPPGSAG